MTKEVFVFAGVNGSGKTSFAERFLQPGTMPFLNADNIAKYILAENISSNANLRAGKIFISALNKYVSGNQSFAIESTLSGHYLKKYLNKLKDAGYKVHIIYMCISSINLSRARVNVRVRAGGHNIPEKDIMRRFNRSRYNFWHVYRNIADIWFMYANDFGQPHLVAFGVKDDYDIKDKDYLAVFMQDIGKI